MLTHVKNLTREELRIAFAAMGEKPFRANQIFEWMYRRGARNFAEMTSLAKCLREKTDAFIPLSPESGVISGKFGASEAPCEIPDETAPLMTLRIKKRLISARDGTRKYLCETADGNLIESVCMKYRFGSSVCVSSQAGCRMGCAFCASGLNGLARDLTPGEMSDQLLLAREDTSEDIRHVVVMGTGEPLDNYENVLKFLENITDPVGLGLGRRQLTVSTCGPVTGMERFLRDMPQANLAISLHAPNDAIRTRIMPIAKTDSVEDIISFARRYTRESGRKITFEYVLIDELNDDPDCADELSNRLRDINCLVNIIPLNHVPETGLVPSSDETVRAFRDRLESNGVGTTVRRKLGADIDAACGQLRRSGAD
ncbi:MAG: 23S rRNA (adenine(2503)-C(2))-methyltransferase RlmN [Clostridiales Family XIII bacterium]|jgi:23S rRNA (adenine2503-C2)-methyltransferase|nr:23S rRNA (adenine(2503)-C(2))-methyltransferase RlmN [Clostridiales Family XIII bacterium]